MRRNSHFKTNCLLDFPASGLNMFTTFRGNCVSNKLQLFVPCKRFSAVRFGVGMNPSFTSSQVSKRTGLTPRQLQWWDEQGIVVPARQGHRRLYSAKDLAELAILCDLRRRGFSLQRIRKMLSLLRREFGHRLADLVSRGPGLHLLTDGESVYLRDSESGVIDLLRNTQQPLLAICVGPVLERVFTPEVTLPPPSQAPKKGSQPVRAARAARALG
jgi:DNA-binding transcriptional MerR regulator